MAYEVAVEKAVYWDFLTVDVWAERLVAYVACRLVGEWVGETVAKKDHVVAISTEHLMAEKKVVTMVPKRVYY